MLILEVYKQYESWSELSRKLGFGSTTYQGWIRRGYIPMRTQEIIELRTKGALTASMDHLTKQNGLERFKKTPASSN